MATTAPPGIPPSRDLMARELRPHHSGGKAMKTSPEIQVTLSDELLESLRVQSQELKIPLKWLVAGLVCDTMDPVEQPMNRGARPSTRHVA
jgi:hypothetical protein